MSVYHQTDRKDTIRTASVISYGDQTLSSARLVKTSPGLFSLLNYEPLLLDTRKLNGQTESAVITMRTKRLLFGESPAIGKVISVDSHKMEIIGIIMDVPEKSSLVLRSYNFKQ